MNKDRLIELLEIPYDELATNKILKTELIEYYKFIYNVKNCTSCKDKFPTYYSELMKNGVEKLSKSDSELNGEDSIFQLRKNIGVLQINFGNGQFINQVEADFDTCISFLKENPNRISMFEKYPENWKLLIQNNESENENE